MPPLTAGRHTQIQKNRMLMNWIAEKDVVALYGTLKRGQRNRPFIDHLIEEGHLHCPPELTTKVQCVMPNMAMIILPGDLPAAYPTNLPDSGIVVELMAVSRIGIAHLRKFEGVPEFYGQYKSVLHVGKGNNQRVAMVDIFTGPYFEGVEVRPLISKEQGKPICWPNTDTYFLGEVVKLRDGGIYV